jgi:uncharacterized membrane protein
MSEEKNKERCQALMMAALDGEITKAENSELQILLNRFPDLRVEYQSFTKLREVTKTMKLKEPDSDIWQTYWYNVYNRLERGLAWFIFTVGAAVVLAYSFGQVLFDLWKNSSLPLILKIGIFGLILGVILLLLSILREKLFLRKHERYKEIRQ